MPAGILALSSDAGVLIAVAGLVVLVVAAAAILLRGRPKRTAPPDIPPAMRPAPSDTDLETPLFQKLQGWGLLLIVFFVIWVPVMWLREPSTNLSQERALKTDAIERGSKAVQLFSEENSGGIGCVRCHGVTLTGGQNLYNGSVVAVPNLTTVCGGASTGHPLIKSVEDIYTTIEEGRNDMPSWSIRFAGALDDQQIQDIVLYLISIQKVPFKDNVCINPAAVAAAASPSAAAPSSSGGSGGGSGSGSGSSSGSSSGSASSSGSTSPSPSGSASP
jgi:mono/diheme cytochrome c family protein